MGVCEDITERKQAEVKIKTSLAEKETLLKEIHHRVKNNLQIIRSLIRFQSMKVNDPKIEELFNECVNRVSAMAVLHEQTYLSKDLANINVKEYLEMLVNDLTAAYNIDMKLKVETDIQIETLGVDTLMPIGLIINEIISNSLKYAFKDRNNGTIKVSMVSNEDGTLTLKILDNGVGIPDMKIWDNAETLGMELIKTLVDQLSGSVDLNNGSGTEFDIQFPLVAA
jgi:two-component sensor histidine kinase